MLNRFGLPVREWEPAGEAETELQRTRRRIRQGKCVGCGSAQRMPRYRLCAACHLVSRYCPQCEHVKALADFWTKAQCKPCQLRRQSVTGMNRDEANQNAVEAMRRANLARSAAIDARVRPLVERGWTIDEIARALDMARNSIRKRVYRLRREMPDG